MLFCADAEDRGAINAAAARKILIRQFRALKVIGKLHGSVCALHTQGLQALLCMGDTVSYSRPRRYLVHDTPFPARVAQASRKDARTGRRASSHVSLAALADRDVQAAL